jgi:hypothetical protein
MGLIDGLKKFGKDLVDGIRQQKNPVQTIKAAVADLGDRPENDLEKATSPHFVELLRNLIVLVTAPIWVPAVIVASVVIDAARWLRRVL